METKRTDIPMEAYRKMYGPNAKRQSTNENKCADKRPVIYNHNEHGSSSTRLVKPCSDQ
jgi:hypothetical protein